MSIHSSPDGQPGSRFYLHARNQADGVLYALRYVMEHTKSPDSTEGLRYSHGATRPYRFHIVGEREVNNLEMAEMIAASVGRPLEYTLQNFHESRPGHDLRYALDGGRMSDLGWEPPVPLEDSLRRAVRWTLDHPEWLL